MPLQVIQPATS